jgi:hypothetical protein
MRLRRATARICADGEAFRSVFPELAVTRVREDPRTEHVGHGRIRQVAIVEDGEAFTNGRVPRLVGGNVDRRANTDELERLPGGVNGHPDAAVRARSGFDEAPVQTVGGLELHPVRHRIASSRTALAAAVGHLRIDCEVAVRCRRRGRADGNRRGEKNGVPFDDIEPLGSGAELEFHCRGIFRLLNRRIKGKRVLCVGQGRAGTQTNCKSGRYDRKNETGYLHSDGRRSKCAACAPQAQGDGISYVAISCTAESAS